MTPFRVTKVPRFSDVQESDPDAEKFCWILESSSPLGDVGMWKKHVQQEGKLFLASSTLKNQSSPTSKPVEAPEPQSPVIETCESTVQPSINFDILPSKKQEIIKALQNSARTLVQYNTLLHDKPSYTLLSHPASAMTASTERISQVYHNLPPASIFYGLQRQTSTLSHVSSDPIPSRSTRPTNSILISNSNTQDGNLPFHDSVISNTDQKSHYNPSTLQLIEIETPNGKTSALVPLHESDLIVDSSLHHDQMRQMYESIKKRRTLENAEPDLSQFQEWLNQIKNTSPHVSETVEFPKLMKILNDQVYKS